MVTTLSSAPINDNALPDEVVGRMGNVITRYRQYPVFSWPWLRGRQYLAMSIILTLTAVNLFALFSRKSHLNTSSVLVVALLTFLSTTLLVNFGPAVAYFARRFTRARLWPQQREAWVVGVALATCLVVQVPLNELSNDYIYGIQDTPVLANERSKLKAETAAKPLYVRAALKTADYGVDLFLLFCIGGGIAFVSFLRERERLGEFERAQSLKAAQQAKQEAEMRLSILQAQIEPHFLFNTLASLRSLVTSDPPRAALLLDKLTDYLRSAMPRTQADGRTVPTTLGAQADAAASYLELMQIRMGKDRLAFRMDVPHNLRALPFPPLMLITLVENAVKHGLEPQVHGGAIHVTAQITAATEGGMLKLSVADNGAGFGNSTSSGAGIGLANTRMRLAQMYGDAGRLELVPQAHSEWLNSENLREHKTALQGFTATIILPILPLDKI